MKPKTAATIGRTGLGVSLLALLGAWLSQLTGSDVLGMSQQHLFFDSLAAGVLGVGMLVDAQVHKQVI